MTYLEVPGASLYYETIGNGPMLLCISGADGSCEIWRVFAEFLKEHFKVVLWDRRGFSRSYLNGAQDYENRIETDTDDAAALIKHLSPDELATVIGNSSGAIVSLKFLIRYPDLVRMVIPYEPPAATLVPNTEALRILHQDVYDTYRRWGMLPAFEKFAKVTKADQATVANSIDPRIPYLFSNTQYWFEREFLQYPFTKLNVEGELAPLKDKLTLVVGELTDKEPYQYRANACLAEHLGLKLEHWPGEHVGHLTHAEEFSQKLLEVLRAKGDYEGK